MTKALVVIPVYNEEQHIAEIIAELRNWFDGDILCIDDGSCDNSPLILEKLKSQNLLVIRHPKNKGYGASLIEGFSYAISNNYDAVVTMDCDWQHEPHFVPVFLEELADVDIVSGSRYLKVDPNDTPAPVDRKKINFQITETINNHTNYGITDAFCGFKAIKVPALRKLSLDEYGYAFPLQFWIQAKHFNLKLKELAVPRIYIDASRTFGGHLDDPTIRLNHYNDVINKELTRWKQQ